MTHNRNHRINYMCYLEAFLAFTLRLTLRTGVVKALSSDHPLFSLEYSTSLDIPTSSDHSDTQ